MDAVGDPIEQLTSLARAKTFFGREFLTWLWYTAETTRERLQLRAPDGAELEVDLWVDDRLVLEGTATMTHQNVMKGGDPSHSREAAASLATGKTVREMKLGMSIRNGGEFSVILGCDDLNPRALKLPDAEPTGEEEGGKAKPLPLAARLQATAAFLSALDALFLRFMAERTSPDWEAKELTEMRDWIRRRQIKQDGGSIH